MTKKDFEFIAETLRQSEPIGPQGMAHDQWHQTCVVFARKLAAVNPRFDSARFLKACGL